jgi:hypothetical protein
MYEIHEYQNLSHTRVDKEEGCLSTVGLYKSFKSWQPIWGRGAVVIHTDNTATLSGLNKGAIRGPSMEPLRALLLLVAAADIELQAVWLASKDNGLLANALSRNQASLLLRCLIIASRKKARKRTNSGKKCASGNFTFLYLYSYLS